MYILGKKRVSILATLSMGAVALLSVSTAVMANTAVNATISKVPANQITAKQVVKSVNKITNTHTNDALIKPINSIAATVGNSIITQDQLNSQMALIHRQLREQRRQVPPTKILSKQVLNQLIDQELQMQQAHKGGVTVSNAQLDSAISNIAKKNHASLMVLKMQVEKQGLSYKHYRERIRKQLLINGAQRKAVASKIQVTNQEVKEALKSIRKTSQKIPQYHLQAILVPVPSAPSPDQVDAAQDRANVIITKLNKGSNFSDIAVANSANSDALQGGDMGWKQLTQLPPAIASQVAAAQSGAIVGPIQTPNGFYIIKVSGMRTISPNHAVTLTHVRHILLKQGSLETGNSVKGRLEAIREQIKKGANFAKMASLHSQDMNTEKKGGDLGWIASNEVPAVLANHMNNLQKGQMSQPIKTKDGWELIQVLGRKEVNNTQKNLENRVRMMLFERKFSQAVNAWVQQLRGSTYIQIMN